MTGWTTSAENSCSSSNTQVETSTLKFINFYELMRYLFDDDELAQKAAEIIRGLLEAQSPRLSNITDKMI